MKNKTLREEFEEKFGKFSDNVMNEYAEVEEALQFEKDFWNWFESKLTQREAEAYEKGWQMGHKQTKEDYKDFPVKSKYSNEAPSPVYDLQSLNQNNEK